MQVKLIGAICLLIGFGYVGFAAGNHHLKDLLTLRELCSHIEYMLCQLQYSHTPLPQLFQLFEADATGPLKQVFQRFCHNMNQRASADASGCMTAAISATKDLPKLTKTCLLELGKSLGRFDLSGQLRGAEATLQLTRQYLSELEENRDLRIRSYQIFGLCTGAALVILLI